MRTGESCPRSPEFQREENNHRSRGDDDRLSSLVNYRRRRQPGFTG